MKHLGSYTNNESNEKLKQKNEFEIFVLMTAHSRQINTCLKTFLWLTFFANKFTNFACVWMRLDSAHRQHDPIIALFSVNFENVLHGSMVAKVLVHFTECYINSQIISQNAVMRLYVIALEEISWAVNFFCIQAHSFRKLSKADIFLLIYKLHTLQRRKTCERGGRQRSVLHTFLNNKISIYFRA